jgi:hypothetical protein
MMTQAHIRRPHGDRRRSRSRLPFILDTTEVIGRLPRLVGLADELVAHTGEDAGGALLLPGEGGDDD